jgi:uracil-DNA glycosylase
MSYDKLVLARKSCRKCAELVNPADPSHAYLDGAEVGPWSRWLASRPAKLILVGQDWGTVGYYREYNGRDIPKNLTNERLKKFLELCGFAVGPPDQTDRLSGVFATNAILCLKQGRANELSAPVKSKWYSACSQFLKWTIEETSAPIVVALGSHAYEAVVSAYEMIPRHHHSPRRSQPHPFRSMGCEYCLPSITPLLLHHPRTEHPR